MTKENNIIHGSVRRTTSYRNLCLGELLLNQLRFHGSQICQINGYTGEIQRFDKILNNSQCLATYLHNAGLKENDCIAICSENNLEFCIPMCAAIFLGVTVCPLNPIYTQNEFIHSLNISKPKYIFTSMIAASNLNSIIPQLSWIPKLVLLSDSDDTKMLNIRHILFNTNTESTNNFKSHKVDIENHVAAILCSSGTTGLPKGVMLTDKNFIAMIEDVSDPSVGFLAKDTVTLSLLPFFHAYSYTTLIDQLIVGSKSVVLSRFEEQIFLQTIEKYKVNYLTLVPPLMVFLAKHPLVAKYDLTSLKIIWCGAAPLSEEVQKTVVKRLQINVIKQGYGLTETTLAVLRIPNNTNNKYGSVGMLAPGHSAKVISLEENGLRKPLGPNCAGELCFKGDLIMKGYCNNEEATKTTIDEEGWLHTGDIGYYDEDHYFYIVDRLKELIKYKGFQVPPAELEAILLTCPGVKDAAVIGMPDEEAGEVPLAFVVKQQHSSITAEDIITYVNERTSIHKRLRGGVKFIETIPKTASGKILRRALRDLIKSKL